MQKAPNITAEDGACAVTRQFSEYAAWFQRGGVSPVGTISLIADACVGETAQDEIREGLIRLYGKSAIATGSGFDRAIELEVLPELGVDAYSIKAANRRLMISGGDGAGVLYGVFRALELLASGENFDVLDEKSAPAVMRRVINHWDNIDGSIERGYSGKSIFFKDGTLDYDPERIKDYARLLASVGINVVAINNVNVTKGSSRLIGADLLPEVAKLAEIFRKYYIKIAVAVHFESPVMLGGLSTSDPLDPEVERWWNIQTDEMYRYIPDFSGYLVKADSEFNGGPHAVGRSQAEGANLLARAVAPHGGVVYWRCFIYDCVQDWRNSSVDRPKAAYDLFIKLDGKFESNVILQVKNGPSDFQVREPLSPLLGGMKSTREALELQITQEYTGQQVDMYNLAVQWQEIMESQVDENVNLQDIIGKKIDAVAAVSNVGSDNNWTGHTLSQLNLYSYGRLSWNPYLKAVDITREWVRLTFGCDRDVVDGVTDMLMRSRDTYEKYNSPLGLGWMVNVGHHYGPSPEGYEFTKWGTYHRSNLYGVGVDRTGRGTGFTKQYPEALAKVYDDPATCPENLLLYFHRLSYDYKLKNGKTLLQHIYDVHFEGAEDVENFIRQWEDLQPLLPEPAYASVRERLLRQLENAKEWRDVINTYFYRKTGIPDDAGRHIYA